MSQVTSLWKLIIAEEHELFEEQESQLKNILEGSIKCRVLLCFDGYDEYTPGTNEGHRSGNKLSK